MKGGVNGWLRFLEKNLQYPDAALASNIQGMVRVRFLIDVNGLVSKPKIIESPHVALSAEVIRLMQASPPWQPATLFNRPVESEMIQAITFRLQ